MDHQFQASLADRKICNTCKQIASQHGAFAVCDSCPNIGPVDMSGELALCKECMQKEIQTAMEHQSPEKQAERLAKYHAELREKELTQAQNTPVLSLDSLITEARQVNNSIELREDLFNAKTVSIAEIIKAFDTEESIPANERKFKCAQFLNEQYQHLKKVTFEMQQELVQKHNEQRAIHTALISLANNLRREEREKLQLQDINYQPAIVKPASSGTRKPKTVKFDKVKLAEAVKEFGMPAHRIQQMCVQQGIDVEAWMNKTRRAIKEIESES